MNDQMFKDFMELCNEPDYLEEVNELKEKMRQKKLNKVRVVLENSKLFADYQDALEMKRVLLVVIEQLRSSMEELEKICEGFSADSRKRCNFDRLLMFLKSQYGNILSQYEEICHFINMYNDDDKYIHKRCLVCFLKSG